MAIALWMLIALASATSGIGAPNVAVILADDLGYGDVGVYNPESKIPTPNLDRVAAEGVRFTDAHAPDGVCTPTRYGLLTGRYAWRTRLTRGVLRSGGLPLIEPGRLTIAGMLHDRGYRTAMVGKWHLGRKWSLRDDAGGQTPDSIDWGSPQLNGPPQHGFSYSFGMAEPAWTFVENGSVLARPDRKFDLRHLPVHLIGPNNNTGVKSGGFEFERMLPRYTEEAAGFIARSARAGEPWFLYFAPLAPHRPVVPNKDFRGKSSAGLYGDFVAEVDWAVGEILAAIERSGQDRDTLLVFTSDNGPEDDAYVRLQEHGHASMGTLRGVKRDLWEGGHRVPFIARWPGRIPAGTVQDEVLCLTDLMATIAAIVGYELSDDVAEDSYDLTPALLGHASGAPVREATVHHGARGEFGIRQGDWVLIDHPTGDNNGNGRPGEPEWFRKRRAVVQHGQPVELYNLRDDPQQTVNLAEGAEERVRSMQAILERYKRDGRSVPHR